MIFVESALPELQQHHDQDHVQQSLLQLTCHLLVEGAEDLQPWVLDQEGKGVLQGTASLCLQDHNFQGKPMLTREITLLKVIKKHTQIEETSLAEISVNLTNNQPQPHQLNNKIEILFLEEETGICLENLD